MIKQKKYKDFEEIKELRSKYITGTRAAAICDTSQWKSALDVYNEMTNPTEYTSYMMERGLALEDFLIQKANDKTGFNFEKVKTFFYDDENHYVAGTPDAVDLEGKVLLECKTTTKFIESVNDIPADYIYQVQLYMYLLGFELAFIIFDTRFEVKIFAIERDEEIIQKVLSRAFEFMTKNILYKKPPVEVKPVKVTSESFKQADSDVVGIYRQWREMKTAKKEIEQELGRLETALKSFADDVEAVVHNDEPLYNYKTYSRQYFDKKALEDDNPELMHKYTIEKNYRRLT